MTRFDPLTVLAMALAALAVWLVASALAELAVAVSLAGAAS